MCPKRHDDCGSALAHRDRRACVPTGDVTSTTLLDREAVSQYILIVRAVDGGDGNDQKTGIATVRPRWQSRVALARRTMGASHRALGCGKLRSFASSSKLRDWLSVPLAQFQKCFHSENSQLRLGKLHKTYSPVTENNRTQLQYSKTSAERMGLVLQLFQSHMHHTFMGVGKIRLRAFHKFNAACSLTWLTRYGR